VENVQNDVGDSRPKLLSGTNGNLPEDFCLSVDSFDCGGPRAFALAHEMIRKGNECQESAWMKRHVLESSTFAILRPFDAKEARYKLAMACTGKCAANPEYSSTGWIHASLGGNPFNISPSDLHCRAGVCNYCLRTGHELNQDMKLCARCKDVHYCSRNCQKTDCKMRKNVCLKK